ncbi:unnamed protein product, partial [Symbiodinium necroappetens]
MERQELQRWQLVLADPVEEAGLPVVEHMKLVRFPESMLLAALGSARAATVGKHVREWKKVKLYCLATSGKAWPVHVGMLLDYLHERYLEPCARTVPQAILASLSFLEKAGGVASDERFLSPLPALRNTVNQLTADLEATGSSEAEGKRVRFLPVFVSRHVFFMKPDWLEVGWSVWSSADMYFERDYFLPLPNADASGAMYRMSDYAHTLAGSKRLLRFLKRPFWDGQRWKLADKFLIVEADVLSFWTEHSERNWLVSVLASLGGPRDKRDFVGRWRVITASDEYIRTAQHVVITLQESALEGVRRDNRWHLVDGGLDDLEVFLADRGVGHVDALAQVALLRLGTSCAKGTKPGGSCPVPPADECILNLAEADAAPPFFIAVAEYDVPCKHCWRNGKQPQDPTREASGDLAMTDTRSDDQILASAESPLRYIMDDVGMPEAMQVKLFRKGFISLHIFAGIDETRAEVRQALATELPLDCSTGAEARVSMALLLTAWEVCRRQISVNDKKRAEAKLGVQDRFVQVTEYAAMREAVENGDGVLGDEELPSKTSKSLLAQKLEQVEDNAPHVEDLRDVTSAEGRTMTTPPGSPEELRLRRIGLAWLMGDKVAGLRTEDGRAPKWSLVLKYEAEVRKNAYKYIRAGEATDIGDAINKACRAPDLLAFHFVTPFSLGAFVLSSTTTSVLALPDSPHVPPPPEPLFARPGKGTGKGGGKDSLKGKGVQKTIAKHKFASDGRLICFFCNKSKGCAKKDCKFAHVCQRCLGEHSYTACFRSVVACGWGVFCTTGLRASKEGWERTGEAAWELEPSKAVDADLEASSEACAMVLVFVRLDGGLLSGGKFLDVQQLASSFADGKVVSCPFSAALIQEGRDLIFKALDSVGPTIAGDPDHKAFFSSSVSFAKGVRLGVGVKNPRVPAVFERKTKWRKYPEECLAEGCDRENYLSAKEHALEVQQQFLAEAEEEAMIEVPTAEALASYGSKLSVASLGAIEKKDGSCRVVHDGTHGVNVNARIKLRDQLRNPTAGDLCSVLKFMPG